MIGSRRADGSPQEDAALSQVAHTGPLPQSVADVALSRQLILKTGTIGVRWRQSARARRISLRLDPKGHDVIITLPGRIKAEAGIAVLLDHTRWVERQMSRLRGGIRFEADAVIPIKGEPHTIRHAPETRGGAWLEGHTLYVSGDRAFLTRRVLDFLRQFSAQELGARVTTLAARSTLRPRRLAIRDTSSRWGSCSSGGRLMLSWRLIMAPLFVQDYVILHELAHLKHMNHSAAFWHLVDTLTPTRHQAEAWLKTHGPALMRAGAGGTHTDEDTASL